MAITFILKSNLLLPELRKTISTYGFMLLARLTTERISVMRLVVALSAFGGVFKSSVLKVFKMCTANHSGLNGKSGLAVCHGDGHDSSAT